MSLTSLSSYVAGRRQRILTLGQAVLLAAVVLGFYLRPLLERSDNVPVDFTLFYASARALQLGENPYGPVPAELVARLPASVTTLLTAANPNLNPPLVAWLFIPLTALPLAQAYLLWGVLSIMAGLAAGWVIWHALFPRNPSRVLTIWLVLFCYYPTFVAIRLGQLTMLIFLMLALAWWAERSRRPVVAGVFVGIALSIKLFLALLLIYYLIRRRMRLIVAAVPAAVVAALLGLLASGVTVHSAYVAVLRNVAWAGANWNASFAGFFGRLFGGAGTPAWVDSPWLAQLLTYSASAAALAALAWLTWPRRVTPGGHRFCTDDLGMGFALVLALLLSPLGWMYYFPMLFIGGWAAWYWTDVALPRKLRWPLIGAWLLSTVPQLLWPLGEISGPILWLGGASLYFYALLLFGATLAAALFIHRRSGGSLL